MSNVKQTIGAHNSALLKDDNSNTARECNCRIKSECPLNGKCLVKSIIYQASVSTSDNKPEQCYVGLTDNTFKTRYNNHTASFRQASKRSSTELSKYIWDLKEKNIEYSIKWNILKRASSYNTTSKRCNLCIWEKYFIICKPQLSTLNKRNELLSSCRHASRFLLSDLQT